MDSAHTTILRDRKALLDRLGIPTRLAVWLRPQHGQAGDRVSKLGGNFDWPSGVAWPVCPGQDVHFDETEVQNDYYVPVAQFLKTDFPEVEFPSGSDILQVLWCPRYHEDPDTDCGMLGPRVSAFWHRIADLHPFPNPMPRCPNSSLLPFECRLNPMRVEDVAHWQDWTAEHRQVFEEFRTLQESQHAPIGEASEALAKLGFRFRGAFGPAPQDFPDAKTWMDLHQRAFRELLDIEAKRREARRASKQSRDVQEAMADLDLIQVPGSKLLGFPEWNGGDYPDCDCGEQMSHLVTFHQHEVGESSEWYWLYDPSSQDQAVHRSVSGTALFDGWVLAFYCTRCQHRPVKSLMLNS